MVLQKISVFPGIIIEECFERKKVQKMNREILFKAKTEMIVRSYNNGLDDGIWVKGYLRCDCGMWLIYQFEYDRADQVAYEVNPETICQYTGLKDKNGKKIWENDIVNCYESECFGVIKWEEDEAKFIFDIVLEDLAFEPEDVYDYIDDMEVVGNIFDNPELLKGSEENG